MMSMWLRILLINLLIVQYAQSSSAQDDLGFTPFFGARKVDVSMKRSGPYFGLQQGKYLVPEFGGEFQWSKIRLSDPVTQAVHMGFTYNFRYKVLGYDVGYWIKPKRIGLTYGVNFCYRSDFTYNRFGIAPVLGFKLLQFHLQTGYHFLTKAEHSFETNTLFISLRFVLINNRNLDVNRKGKKLFGK